MLSEGNVSFVSAATAPSVSCTSMESTRAGMSLAQAVENVRLQFDFRDFHGLVPLCGLPLRFGCLDRVDLRLQDLAEPF